MGTSHDRWGGSGGLKAPRRKSELKLSPRVAQSDDENLHSSSACHSPDSTRTDDGHWEGVSGSQPFKKYWGNYHLAMPDSFQTLRSNLQTPKLQAGTNRLVDPPPGKNETIYHLGCAHQQTNKGVRGQEGAGERVRREDRQKNKLAIVNKYLFSYYLGTLHISMTKPRLFSLLPSLISSPPLSSPPLPSPHLGSHSCLHTQLNFPKKKKKIENQMNAHLGTGMGSGMRIRTHSISFFFHFS